MTATSTTILLEISAAIKSGPQRHVRALQAQAAYAFAALNNWRTGPDIRGFPPEAIGKRQGDIHKLNDGYSVWDHCLYFRDDYSNVAIAAQPYEHAHVGHAHQAAVHYGLRLHVPPYQRASIWVPNSTSFFVFTAPAHEGVRWLPEQLFGIGAVSSNVIQMRRS